MARRRCRIARAIWLVAILAAFSAEAVSGEPVSTAGLYRNGQWIESLREDLFSPDSRYPDIGFGNPLSDLSAPLAGSVNPPPVSSDTRTRNLIFGEAARRFGSIREMLQQTVRDQTEQLASQAGRISVDAQELLRRWQWFASMEGELRNALLQVGERVRDLDLDPLIYARHLATLEEFDRGMAELSDAIGAVLRGEPDAVTHALKLLEERKFREDPPLLSGGLPYQMQVEQAPIIERQKAPSFAVRRQPVGPILATPGTPWPAGPGARDAPGKEPPPEGTVLAFSPPPPAPEDLAPTIDVQITAAITNRAAELGNSPVAIYEFVRNSVTFEPYLGSRKGSVETLRQLRGNDTDQASLLLALLRAAGIPSRYVRGTVEISAEQAKRWLGVDNPSTAADILTTAGLGGVAIVDGPDVVAVRLTHVWVEAFVPYANYRGVPNDSYGKIWIPLAPSFKSSMITPGMDVLTPMGFDVDAFLSDYISTFHTPSPIEKLMEDVQAYLDTHHPGTNVSDIERRTEIAAQTLGILPGSLPFQVLSVSARFAELESSKRFKVRFHLYSGATTFIDHTMNLAEFIGKRVTIDYIGATAADQATIDSFGGIYNTPPDLVDVKPRLKLDNVAVATSTNAIGMGRTHSSDMQFIQPSGASNVQPLVQNQIIAGNGQAIGFDTFLDVNDLFLGDGTSFPPEAFLEGVLHATALDYLNRVDRGQERVSRLMQMVMTQDVSEAIVANSIAVAFSFGKPVTFEWTGLTVDADRRIIGPFAVNGDGTKGRPFMILTGMDGSNMENRVFEDIFGQQAVSTVKILGLASYAGNPICTIQTSIALDCPGMSQPSFIVSAVNAALAAGHVVTIPKAQSTIALWSGTGYIDMDPVTGAAGYIISGGISGGVQTIQGGATVETWPITLPCEATGVTGVVTDPPADSPDPKAIFCPDNSPLKFKVTLTTTCEDGSTKIQNMTLQTSKTKKQIADQFGPGDYVLRLIAFGSATVIRKISLVGVGSIEASLPSTKNPVTDARPVAGTFVTTNKDLAFVPPAPADLMALMKNAGEITAKAKDIQPAVAKDLIHWQIDRNPADTVAAGTPGLNPTAGEQVAVTPDTPGNFRLICYCDANGNNKFDNGEELRVLRSAILRTTPQPGASLTAATVFTGRINSVSTENAAGQVPMRLQADILLEGGGADMRIGVSHIVLGNVGTLLNDTFVVNYPGRPAPADTRDGTETEDPDFKTNPAPGFPSPMVDTVNVAQGNEPTGGSTPFRGNSADTVLGNGPGGNGQLRRVTSLDAPAFGWHGNHPTTGNPWGTTQGVNAFREWIVGYSTTFPRNYMAFGQGDWTVTATGTRGAGGLWTDNGSTVTGTALTTAGYPRTGDAAGVQVLGLSFVREYGMIIDP